MITIMGIIMMIIDKMLMMIIDEMLMMIIDEMMMIMITTTTITVARRLQAGQPRCYPLRGGVFPLKTHEFPQENRGINPCLFSLA
jgi:hypothetical protein